MRRIDVGQRPLLAEGAPGGPEPLRAVCHDLRQAVAAVRVLASIAVDDVDATQRRLDAIVGQCDWLSAVIDVGLEPAEPRTIVDVSDVVAHVVARAKITSSAMIYFDPAPRLNAWTCEVGLGRIVENLLENAIHAAGAGTVQVQVFHRGQNVVVTVADDGPGIGGVAARTSLGLTIVRTAAIPCGARISSAKPDGRGYQVAVSLDAWDGAGR
jgi:K+-sensing histidine kinase KdpD